MSGTQLEQNQPGVRRHGLNSAKNGTLSGTITSSGTFNVSGTFQIGGVAVSSTAAELNILDGVTATAAELNAAADVSGRYVDIGDNTTYTVLSANSGKIHTLPDLTADIVITLPSVSAGLQYEFHYAGVAADAQDWQFDTGSDTNYYLGGLVVLDTGAGDEVGIFYPDGDSNSKLNVLTPGGGTELKLFCDGTNWIISGRVVSATDPTFADQ